MTGEPPLTGRVCVISGGSRGIGAQLAAWLAEAGADVAICSRRAGDAQRVAAELAGRFNVRVLGSACDVRDPRAVDAWIRSVASELGRVDVAVANAAVFGPVGPLDTVDMSEWMHTLAVDVGGVANVAHSAVPVMRRQGFGRLLALSGGGVGGPRPLAMASAYAASKAAVCVLMEALALELEGTGVTANAVAPGAVPTGFMDGALVAGAEVAGDVLFAAASDRTPPDMSGLLALLDYLVSERSGWLTGRVLSARWDSVGNLEKDRPVIEGGSRLRLRRIDADLYGELTGRQS